MAQTFTNSQMVLQYLQSTYGSANYSQWQSLRKQFYSFINYPAAGANQFNFFGFAVTGAAGQNKQYTNMPKAGSFGQQHFLLKSIQTAYYLSTPIDQFTIASVSDTQNFSADILHGFTQVPNVILREANLSIGAKLAYAMFLSYAWNNDSCFPGQERLAQDMGMSRTRVTEFIGELERAGLIGIQRRGQGRTNLYTIHFKVTSRRPDVGRPTSRSRPAHVLSSAGRLLSI